jgi:hypothetical protein
MIRIPQPRFRSRPQFSGREGRGPFGLDIDAAHERDSIDAVDRVFDIRSELPGLVSKKRTEPGLEFVGNEAEIISFNEADEISLEALESLSKCPHCNHVITFKPAEIEIPSPASFNQEAQ